MARTNDDVVSHGNTIIIIQLIIVQNQFKYIVYHVQIKGVPTHALSQFDAFGNIYYSNCHTLWLKDSSYNLRQKTSTHIIKIKFNERVICELDWGYHPSFSCSFERKWQTVFRAKFFIQVAGEEIVGVLCSLPHFFFPNSNSRLESVPN